MLTLLQVRVLFTIWPLWSVEPSRELMALGSICRDVRDLAVARSSGGSKFWS